MGSSASGISGSNAALSSNKQAKAYQNQMYQASRTDLTDAEKRAQGYIAPYADVGGSALNELAYGMGLQTPTAGYTSANTQQGGLANYGQDQYQKDVGYTPMVNSLADLQATPGYQFQLEQGLQGVNNSAAARGGLLSGANMKAINDYAQGQASTGYQNAWDRAQNAYSNAFNRNQQKFSNLQSMANNGQTAAGTQGSYANQLGANLSNLNMGNATSMNNLLTQQGQLQQQKAMATGALVNQGITGLVGGNNISSIFSNGAFGKSLAGYL